MFEKASRLKLRFKTPVGNLGVEDVWDLPLLGGPACLDDLAKHLNKRVRENTEESFVERSAKPDERLTLMFEIVKHVIDVRLKEKEEAEQAEKNRQRKQQILEIIAAKETESLKESSIDELRGLLESL